MLDKKLGSKEFLYLFNVVDFDEKGAVCKTKEYEENDAKANFLYLVSKYNQKLLEENEKIDDFFKNDLQNVLDSVKNGGDFDKAKKEVVAHCKSDVRNEFKSAKSDEDFIKKLNQIMVKHETGFAKQFEKAVNNLQLSYIITSISGNLFNEILELGDGTVKEKSNMYKKIVDYNALIHIAEKVASNELSKEDVCRTGRTAC